jgi:hypothetical protein
MSDPVPLKMSQFEVSPVFPTGSYLIAVVPTGSSFRNVRVSRWKSVPLSSSSGGNDGDEAMSGSYYYLNSGGTWYKFSGSLF